jgi:peptide/nickel transport system substrate-binding protein
MLNYLSRVFKALHKTERILFYAAGGIFCGALVVTLWMTFITHTTLQPARGGEYTEGLVGQPTAVNPMLIGSSAVDKDLAQVLFADLVTLAHSVATSTTGKVWVVTLKEDMVWSDGKAITADDVLFTVHTIQNPDAGSPLLGAWQGITVERVSQLEVRFTLKSPYAYFMDNLRSLRIAPAHIFESIPASNIRLSSYNLEPVGSGAYTFVSYEKERSGFITQFHLAANNDYPGTRSLIENINFKFYPTYTDAILAFNRKAIDGLGGFDPGNVNDLKISHHTYELAVPHYYALFFNGTNTTVLKDKNVRLALALATNKKQIVQDIFSNHANQVEGPLPPALPGYDKAVYANNHFSTEEAAALLDKQGWKVGSDGVRTRTVGKTTQRLELTLTVPDITFLTSTADLIKTQWGAIGAKITIKTVSPDAIRTTVVDQRDYQVLLFGNILRANTDLYSFWHSSQRFQPGLNLAVYENKNVDQLIDTTRKTFDEATRNQALSKIEQQINTDNPAIFLFSPTYLYAAPNNLGGLEKPLLAAPEDRLSTINEWFLETNRVFK